MKIQRFVVLFLFILSAAAAATMAQAVPATTAPTKIAVIDTAAFGDPQAGVKRLVSAVAKLDTEFKVRRDEITTLKARYDALVKEVNNPAQGVTPQVLSQKADQARSLETEIKRKQEDGANAYSRRAAELTTPINQSLYNALEAFAKSRGVDILIDLTKNRDSMIVLNNAVNITQAFIADFNAKNP